MINTTVKDEALKFLQPGYFYGDLANTMLTALSNALQILCFSPWSVTLYSVLNLPNQRYICLCYNQSGPGHFDAASLITEGNPDIVSDQVIKCSCGKNTKSLNVYLSSKGDLITMEESQYVWIDDVFAGDGVAPVVDQCAIELPLTVDPLCALLAVLRKHFKHNLFPCVMMMAAGVLSLHFQSMIRKWKNCPIPLMFGESGTGKTTALFCARHSSGCRKLTYIPKLPRRWFYRTQARQSQ